jgi:hypothetical protein
MRRLNLLLWLSLWLPIGIPAQPSMTEIVYNERSDEQCPAGEVRAEWVAELQSRLSEFRSVWQGIGPPMLSAVTALTGKAIEPVPRRVLLTLCGTPSQAVFGVSVNMRFVLRSFTAQPVPLRYKADTVFHEILHGFISRYTPRNSALLSLHGSESRCVRNHLHLLALQKAVLLSLNRSEELAQVVSIDSQLPSGCYKRAWALVNESEGVYEKYVAELASGT